MKRTSDALIAAYGPPAEDERFVLGEAVDLARMTVRNVLTGPAALKEKVRELIWRRDGCELFVWFARQREDWVTVQTFWTQAGRKR